MPQCCIALFAQTAGALFDDRALDLLHARSRRAGPWREREDMQLRETARIDQVIAACVLGEFLNKQARHCSGGVRRRLNIAIGLLQKPDVLLLDEPTIGVDPQTRLFLLDQVGQLARQGAAIVYATHYMEEAMAVCNEILILDHGHVVACGDLAALLKGTAESGPFANLEALFMHNTQRSLRD